jgi:proton-translocating NADH-quinone oxidoreductase chain N
MVGRIGQKKANGNLAGVTASVFSALSFVSALFLALEVWENTTAIQTFGGGMLSADALGVFLILVASALTLVVSIYSIGYMKDETRKEHFFSLLLLMTAGIVGIGLSRDLFTLYVFYELMCIASYVLVAFKKDKWDSVEAGMKYIVLSAAGSAFALFGIALTYAQFQTLDMGLIMSGLAQSSGGQLAVVSVLLLIVGFGVKAAIVPLHTWLPDAHSAAPSGISAMLSGIVIEAGFIVLLKALLLYSGTVSFGELLIVLAVITMTVGNVMAFVQTAAKNADLKRVLAYSSIAQVGYIIMGIGIGLAYGVEMGFRGGTFHIMTHAVMKGLAFLCAGAIIYRLGTREIKKMRGIGHVMPVTAFAFSIAALSLAGAPPLGGFMSEFMIFKAGVDASAVIGWVGILLSVILLLNSVLSLGYYLPIIKAFFLKPKRKWSGIKETPMIMLIPIVILAAIVVTLGIWPEIGLKAVEPVVEFFMQLGGGG